MECCHILEKYKGGFICMAAASTAIDRGVPNGTILHNALVKLEGLLERQTSKVVDLALSLTSLARAFGDSAMLHEALHGQG